MKKLLYITIILFCSCKSQECKNINYELINKFEKNLSIIKKEQDPKDVTNVDEYRAALLYLANTTGIMTRADYSSTIGYQNKSDYRHDRKVWKEWLNKNKCLASKNDVNPSKK